MVTMANDDSDRMMMFVYYYCWTTVRLSVERGVVSPFLFNTNSTSAKDALRF